MNNLLTEENIKSYQQTIDFILKKILPYRISLDKFQEKILYKVPEYTYPCFGNTFGVIHDVFGLGFDEEYLLTDKFKNSYQKYPRLLYELKHYKDYCNNPSNRDNKEYAEDMIYNFILTDIVEDEDINKFKIPIKVPTNCPFYFFDKDIESFVNGSMYKEIIFNTIIEMEVLDQMSKYQAILDPLEALQNRLKEKKLEFSIRYYKLEEEDINDILSDIQRWYNAIIE